MLPPELAAQLQSGIDPQNFLLAAADLHQQGALASDVPVGKALPAKAAGRAKKLKVIK
jgi:hypothetical protein